MTQKVTMLEIDKLIEVNNTYKFPGSLITFDRDFNGSDLCFL